MSFFLKNTVCFRRRRDVSRGSWRTVSSWRTSSQLYTSFQYFFEAVNTRLIKVTLREPILSVYNSAWKETLPDVEFTPVFWYLPRVSPSSSCTANDSIESYSSKWRKLCIIRTRNGQKAAWLVLRELIAHVATTYGGDTLQWDMFCPFKNVPTQNP